jgi:TonB family protein
LAARFSAQSGGGLSAELSTDLALEIVLNEVVQQACLSTGATGAAIALQRDGEMVCRASSGATAPALGSRLDAAAGLLGECIRTHRTQRSDDAWADRRVDVEAAQRLGVRSVMVMPLLRGEELVGLFEVFSSLPNAFGERDEHTLDALALRILSNLKSAAQPLIVQNERLPLPEIQEIIPEISESSLPVSDPEEIPENSEESSSQRGFDFVTWALRVAVVVCAVMLGLLLGRHWGTRKAVVRRHPAAILVAADNTSAAITPPPEASTAEKQKQESAVVVRPSISAKRNAKTAPPGSLVVFENGKEIFRMPPARNESAQSDGAQKQAEASPGRGSGVERASSQELEKSDEPGKVSELSPAAAQDSLVHRVEPEYPQEARRQKIQGSVVLDVQIQPDGAVQDVRVVSGPPELAQASTNAVRQWRFKPRLVNGRAVTMQTTITLNFRLPH